MIEKFHVRQFKSMVDVEIEPGIVNVLVGANGSGKSNLLEAIGVLSAAAGGRVDDEALLRRGVRPGVPALYKSSFPDIRSSPHIYFGAWNAEASYEVTLHNEIKESYTAWRYKTESWKRGEDQICSRGPRGGNQLNAEAGLAALEAVNHDPETPAMKFLNDLRKFAIFSPNTPTLRSITADIQQRVPVGLSGGNLPHGVFFLRKLSRSTNGFKQYIQNIQTNALSLIDWAASFGTTSTSKVPISSFVGTTERIIGFHDKYMRPNRNVLSGYDASEGALYVLFHAVLAAHPDSPSICAVDNADHGLNPRLSRELFRNLCDWYVKSPYKRQILLTTHNPLTLDGLPLRDERVRLFTVSRTHKGHTSVKRVILDSKIEKMVKQGWTLSRLWVMGHIGGIADV